MLPITSFSPIQSINALIKPLRLTISSKKQILTKITIVALAILTFSEAVQIIGKISQKGLENHPLTICVNQCNRAFNRTQLMEKRNCGITCYNKHISNIDILVI